MHTFVYEGNKTKEISFPLGGIGSGCVGLAGNGRLLDWEIFNRPNKGSVNGYSHFAVKAEQDGKVLDARVLNGDLPPPFTGSLSAIKFNQFGFGPCRETMAGMPHFESVSFIGEYPFADLKFIDQDFPADISLKAFNPLIPLNSKDSSIPGAFFEFEIRNILNTECDYTISFALSNPAPSKATVHKYQQSNGLHMMYLDRNDQGSSNVDYGNMTIATDASDVSYQEYWYRGHWFDNLSLYWHDMMQPGGFKNRSYAKYDAINSIVDTAMVAACVRLAPGEIGNVRFVLTWHYPNCHNYWSSRSSDSDCGCTQKEGEWKNYYATVFENSLDSAGYALQNWKRLYRDTARFKDTLFSSTLPREAVEAVSANISILKSPTTLRLEDGSFYGFEGLHCDSGCCEGTCTHVWNYAYALPFLFPDLERSIRELDYAHNLGDDGSMMFRLQLPVGSPRWEFIPCVDGQFGGVIKTYRDWKISGDNNWLKQLWPAIKKNLEFAWSNQNADKWDPDKSGILTGRQHHTLDMELFGPNAWLQGFYLVALKAAAEMAKALGEPEVAKDYLELYQKGQAYLNEHLFNGEYYIQKIDLEDREILTPYADGAVLQGEDIYNAYWSDEIGELKYQVGEGCGIDQVLAQWHANLCGLGDVFDKEQTRSALQSIHKYNFIPNMRRFANPCRIFCINGESGTVICSFPEGKRKPIIPIPYAEETMYGFEYQVAVHMIQEGLVDEGMEIVRAIRDKFDGEKRNPWNEFECGSNYARSMASYALLNAFSGFSFDMTKKRIGFAPIIEQEYFSVFWSLGTGWGRFELTRDLMRLSVDYGSITIEQLLIPMIPLSAILDGREVAYTVKDGVIYFSSEITINKDSNLDIHY